MKLLCSNGVKAVMLELIPEFERTSGKKLAITWASTAMLLDQIGQGASGDLTILTAEAIDGLIAQGKVVAGSRVDLARSAIGIAVRKGARKPDIGSTQALREALLAAKSISYSRTGISGIYFPTVLERLGIADEMKGKIVIPDTGVMVGDVVVKGDAELGIQQISELLPVAGIEIVGPLPPELQKMTVFSAGLFAGSQEAEAAGALLRALAAPAARPLYRAKGMEPVG